MSDTYQAVYDATRSKIGSCDTHDAIQRAISDVFGNVNHVIQCAVQDVAYELSRPSALHKPKLSIDGDKWCALYGENLQDGVAGFGDSPALAMNDFDRSWNAKLNKQPGESA